MLYKEIRVPESHLFLPGSFGHSLSGRCNVLPHIYLHEVVDVKWNFSFSRFIQNILKKNSMNESYTSKNKPQLQYRI